MNPELCHAGLTDHAALAETPGLFKQDAGVQVVGILPHVAGVRFADVDDIKGDPVLVLIVQLVQGGNLPPEGRSGIAAEDEDYRLRSAQRGQAKVTLFVDAPEIEVGRDVAGPEGPSARIHPERSEREHHERRIGHVLHRRRERVRRLTHHGIQSRASGAIDQNAGAHHFQENLHAMAASNCIAKM